MLLLLNGLHDYGWRQVQTLADYQTEQRPLRLTFVGPERMRPTTEEVARAREACEPLSRHTDLAHQQLADTGRRLYIGDRRVDYDGLRNAFGYFDRLRIAAIGLSRSDRDQISSFVVVDPSLQEPRRWGDRLAAVLRTCGYLAGEMKEVW